jgi:hypothetical protein
MSVKDETVDAVMRHFFAEHLDLKKDEVFSSCFGESQEVLDEI